MKSSIKKILLNFTSLSFLQLSNYLFPLITFPYLVRVLGPEKYGLLNFANAFIGYFIVIIDYGFQISATQAIAIHRKNEEKISEIYCSVIIVKIFLLIMCSIIFFVCMNIFESVFSPTIIYYFAFASIMGHVLSPIWFFLGLENMKFLSIISIPINFLKVILIFLIVTEDNDLLKLVMLNSSSIIAIGVIGLTISIVKYNIHLHIPSISTLLGYLRNNFHIFVSNISISLYTITNIFFLGLFSNNVIVGYFVGAEKIISFSKGIIFNFSQALFPNISSLSRINATKAYNKIWSIYIFVIPIVALISFGTFMFAEPIVHIILGYRFSVSIIILKYLSFVPLIVCIATVFANLFLLGFGYSKQWCKMIILSLIISITSGVVLLSLMNQKHIAISLNILITELFVMLLSFYFYKKKISIN